MVVELMPDNIGKVFFTNGGADANENAIKMARMYTGRKKIFSRYRSYHGSTFGAGNLTGEPRRYPLEPGIPGFVKFFDPYMYRDNLPFATEKECSDYYVKKLREQVIYEGPEQRCGNRNGNHHRAPTALLFRRRATLKEYARSATTTVS